MCHNANYCKLYSYYYEHDSDGVLTALFWTVFAQTVYIVALPLADVFLT